MSKHEFWWSVVVAAIAPLAMRSLADPIWMTCAQIGLGMILVAQLENTARG